MQPARLVPSSLVARHFFSSRAFLCATPFSSTPAPPRLPKEEQELYEKLQQSSTGAFSTPNPTLTVDQSPPSLQPSSQRLKPPINQSPHHETHPGLSNKEPEATVDARFKATGDGQELHPDIRKGVLPEFEGERNPKTGEVGGPKNEPLRWGGEADWSYNGRVTDF